MDQTQKLQWDKLKIELGLLNVQDPSSILPLILQVDQFLIETDELDQVRRKADFLSYELATQCENLLENDRVFLLNDFFFAQNNFQTSSDQNLSPTQDLASNSLTDRRGKNLNIALIYLHLASHIDLPIYLINLPHHNILKWVRSGRSEYIDLSRNGKALSEEDLIKILNSKYNAESEHKLSADNQPFDIMPSRNILELYLDQLETVYLKKQDHRILKKLYDLKINICSTDTKALAQRALILKSWGQREEALKDIKQLLSFVNFDQISPEIKLAYFELKSPDSNTSNTMH